MSETVECELILDLCVKQICPFCRKDILESATYFRDCLWVEGGEDHICKGMIEAVIERLEE